LLADVTVNLPVAGNYIAGLFYSVLFPMSLSGLASIFNMEENQLFFSCFSVVF